MILNKKTAQANLQSCENPNQEYASYMSAPIQEIRCTCGKLTVDNARREVVVENLNHRKVSVDQMTFASVLEKASHGQSLISSDNGAAAVDPQGHQVSVTIHNRPSDPHGSSWANVQVDQCSGVQLDSLQLSQLRKAL